MPKFFNIILKTSAGSVVKETAVQHRTGQAVADFSVSLPQSVDVCTLHVRIRAGNSVGISSPSEAVEVGELQFIASLLMLTAFSLQFVQV